MARVCRGSASMVESGCPINLGRPCAGAPHGLGRPRAAARAKKLYSARLPHYRRAAFALDTAGLKPAAAARLIKERLAAKEKI